MITLVGRNVKGGSKEVYPQTLIKTLIRHPLKQSHRIYSIHLFAFTTFSLLSPPLPSPLCALSLTLLLAYSTCYTVSLVVLFQCRCSSYLYPTFSPSRTVGREWFQKIYNFLIDNSSSTPTVECSPQQRLFSYRVLHRP